jgi:cytoskeletal protein CcmA (bactofilin family)
MFFRKNKQKKSNFQSPVNPEHEDKNNIGVPSDNIKLESKISNISKNLHIIGTVFSSGKISFNGSIKGTLETKSLYVGENGFIDGKVEADEAVILGRIKGTLKGNKVRLASSSRIEGDTYHQVIAIEDGAIYEGSIQRIKST